MVNWQTYWQNAAPTLRFHHLDTDAFLEQHAAEIRFVAGDAILGDVLEFGCGPGLLFGHLLKNAAHYKGVDLSAALLDAFRQRHPTVDVVVGDMTDYTDQRRYDLLISVQAAQFLSPAQLNRHVALSRQLMKPDGKLVVAGIPDACRRLDYCLGRYSPPFKTRVLTGLKRAAVRMIRGDGMGFWYRYRQVIDIGVGNGFDVQVFASPLYPYRFNAAFTLRSA